jgi:anaerobic magnesium-protoporphyrin IX monomethyl ester cyclase
LRFLVAGGDVKILLCRPANREVYGFFKLKTKERVMPPLGLMYLAAYVRKALPSQEISIWDEEVQPIDFGRIGEFDIVGAGGTTPEYDIMSDFFRRVKEINPAVVTVAGGAHFSVVARPEDSVDFIITGEGEIAFAQLVDDLQSGRRKQQRQTVVIEGVPVDDLDEIPFPARDLVDNDKYTYMFAHRLDKATMLASSRGCPYRCTFCHNSKIPRKLRFRSVGNVVAELADLARYGVTNVVFVDETFTVRKERIMDLCDGMIGSGVSYQWACLTRADAITVDVARKMRDAGCREVSIGVESGNESILQACCKQETKEDIVAAMDILAGCPEIEKRTSYIIGHPHETWQTAMDTINFAKQLKPDRAFFNIMTPYPSSLVYDMAKRGDGIRLLTENWQEYRRYGNCVIETDDLTRDQLIELQRIAYEEFWSQPRVVLNHMNRLIGDDEDRRYYYRPVIDALMARDKELGDTAGQRPAAAGSGC